MVGQPSTSILFDPVDLAQADQRSGVQPESADSATACADLLLEGEDPSSPHDGPVDWSFRHTLRLLVQPYLAEQPLDIDQAAELIGTSKRTLQRKLQKGGCSYKDIVKEARFNLAMKLLQDPSIKIIDIAFAAGYQNQQHFSRAFRSIQASRRAHFAARPGTTDS